MKFSAREDIIALTPQWKGERFPDGRPRVADKYLKKLEEMTLEEIWKPIFVKGYESQFEGRLQVPAGSAEGESADDLRKKCGVPGLTKSNLSSLYNPRGVHSLGRVTSVHSIEATRFGETSTRHKWQPHVSP